MNAQEAARILAKDNDSVVVVGITREASGDLISDECFLNLDEFHAAVVCANLEGKQLIKIDKWYPSSQLCHVCGYQNSNTKDLSVREWDCPKCGSHHNRDKNAAINIREEARRISA